jgi:hypothetical protein
VAVQGKGLGATTIALIKVAILRLMSLLNPNPALVSLDDLPRSANEYRET